MKPVAVLLVLAMALPAAGCSGLEPAVKPYERSLLEDPIMDRDRDLVSSGYIQRVYECGEGARGGTGDGRAGSRCH